MMWITIVLQSCQNRLTLPLIQSCFFILQKKQLFILGNSFSAGDRTGGDIDVIGGNADNNHTYFETNNTIRNTTTLDIITEDKR